MALSERDEVTDRGTAAKVPPVITERDIVFNCEHCGGELVVDCDGAGVQVACSHCGRPLIIPPYQPKSSVQGGAETTAAIPAEIQHRFDFTGFSPDQLGRRLEELKHQLKENRSQDTELRGHVNRATIELHRLQLKLQKLHQRHIEIEAEASAARQHINRG